MRFTFPLKNTPLTLFIFVVFFFSGGSCSRWNIGDIGPTVSVTRIINDATHLEISQKFDVILKQDTTAPEFYIIEYPEKLIPNIVHELKDQILKISDNNRGKWTQDLQMRPKITVNLHRYTSLNINGSSKWTCSDTLRGKALNIEMSSVMDHNLWIDYNDVTGKCNNLGSLTLSGRGTLFSFTVESGSQLNAGNMRCHDAYFWHFTQKDCFVSPEKQAFLYLYNSGNVYIKPVDFYRFEFKEKGSGRIIYKP